MTLVLPFAFWKTGAGGGTPEVDDGLHRQIRVSATSLYVANNRQAFVTLYNDNTAVATINWINLYGFAPIPATTIPAGGSFPLMIFNNLTGRGQLIVPLNGTYFVTGGGSGPTPTITLTLPMN